MIPIILIVAIILIALAIVVISLDNWRRIPIPTLSWIHLARTVIALFWVALYTLILFAPAGSLSLTWLQVNLVRPAILATLGVAFCAEIISRIRGQT
jgi:hypothetical protein